MRRFVLNREQDISGVSGLGFVAEGVQWSDGTATVRWLTDPSSTAVWGSVEDVERVHGHGGATRVVWVDELTDAQPTVRGVQIGDGCTQHNTFS